MVLIAIPLLALVAQEPVEDVFPQRLRHEFGPLHLLQRLGERLGEPLDTGSGPLGGGHLEHVVGHLRRQLVVALDARQPGGEHHG